MRRSHCALSGRSSRLAHVLLIEDDDANGALFAEVLISRGHSVDLAWPADQVLQAGSLRAPDLVVTDVHLPGASAEQILAQLRARAVACLPVIGVSASPERRWAQQHGLLAFLEKPFPMSVFADVARRCLDLVELASACGGPGSTESVEEPSPLAASSRALTVLEERLASASGPEEVAGAALAAARELLGGRAGWLSRFTNDGLLRPLAGFGLLEGLAPLTLPLPSDAPVPMVQAAHLGRMVIEEHPERASSDWPEALLPIAMAYPASIVVAAPMDAGGSPLGTMTLVLGGPSSSEPTTAILRQIADLAGRFLATAGE